MFIFSQHIKWAEAEAKQRRRTKNLFEHIFIYIANTSLFYNRISFSQTPFGKQCRNGKKNPLPASSSWLPPSPLLFCVNVFVPLPNHRRMDAYIRVFRATFLHKYMIWCHNNKEKVSCTHSRHRPMELKNRILWGWVEMAAAAMW